MMNDSIQEFIDVITKYDTRDLLSVLIICSDNFAGDKNYEIYDGSKNLFAKIITLADVELGNERIDFNNQDICESICEKLMTFLIIKYQKDCAKLSNLARCGKISRNQFLYYLSSPKTFPRVFVESLPLKLEAFGNFLKERYDLTISQLKNSCERILRKELSCFSAYDVMNHVPTNITQILPSEFLDDLISINERNCDLCSIDSNSRKTCFPVVRVNGEYHLISPEVFIDNFYKCVHRLYSKSVGKDEKDALANIKSQLFNDNCESIFKKIGFGNVYSNYEYKKGEIDLLVDDNDVLFVVECKARNYTDKIPTQSASYIKANQHNLEFASQQIHRFIDELKDKKVLRLRKKDDSISVSLNKYSFIIPIVINIDNLAEVNADFVERDNQTVFISFDDFLIIADVIQDRKWLVVDFFNQLLNCKKRDVFADDIVDMFAFYCRCKNLGILFSTNYNVCIYQLGNDYFQPYFSYDSDVKPISAFENDIESFHMNCDCDYKNGIAAFHKTNWFEIEDIIKISRFELAKIQN